MTVHISVQEASNHLTELAQQALNGQEVVINLDEQGIEQVTLVPAQCPSANVSQTRIPGIDAGKFVVPEDFNEPLSNWI